MASASAAAADPASSVAAAVAGGAPAGSVFVKRAGDVDAVFAKVPIFHGDVIADLAERASAKFSWLVGADKIKLFLVPDGLVEVVQRNPAREADVLVDTNLCLATVLLADASIRDRSCLLARLSSPPAAAPGECARAARRLLSCLPSRGAGGARPGRERDSAGDFAGRSPFFVLAFPFVLPFEGGSGGGGGGSSIIATTSGGGGGGSIDVAAALRASVESYGAIHTAAVPLPPLSSTDYERFISDSRFALAAAKLARGQALTHTELMRVIHMLVRVVTPTTARRFSSASTFVLDGPIPDARGQPGVELLYAFSGSRICCAKVGSRAALEHELGVSVAVHAASFAPTVVCAAALETVTRRATIEPYAALMMPLYSMTVGVASLAMDAGVGAAREAFVLNVALCALAAVKAFNLASFAHGDIKPSNLLIAGDSTGVIVLCDLGTARLCGEPFAESSDFSLNLERTASLRYDVVSLGATLASLLSSCINVRLCGDVAALRKVIDGLSEHSSLLWRFVEACLSFADDGAAAELEQLRSLLAGIADVMRSALGPHAATILREQDVWPRPKG